MQVDVRQNKVVDCRLIQPFFFQRSLGTDDFIQVVRQFVTVRFPIESSSVIWMNIIIGSEVKAEVRPELLQEAAEAALAAALAQVAPVADQAFEQGDYTASLQALTALKARSIPSSTR